MTLRAFSDWGWGVKPLLVPAAPVGQVERMNRTIKDATVKRYRYDGHDQPRTHLQLFVDAYDHARRLKTLRGLAPHAFIHQAWAREPGRFRLDPSHHTPGPYT